MMTLPRILIVDDDEVTRTLLKEVLERDGYPIVLAASGEEAIRLIRASPYPIIVSDMRMLEADGMAVLRAAKKADPETSVILMTGFGNMEGAIGAIQEGAFDYISKPFKNEVLRTVVKKASKHWESLKSSQRLPLYKENLKTPAPKSLIGKSPQIVEVYKMLARAGMSSSTVLITGESGTGKELVARAIHDHSQRRDKRFIAVNCGAIAETLLESELFGHVKGSFTGAGGDKQGLFEEANGGTLFLDEVGDISQAVQIKLLRVLQEGEIKPVGSATPKKVNVRVVAATHRDLESQIRAGQFREDLFYRLKVIQFELPPLRERMEDLPLLVEYFVSKYAEKNKKSVSHVSKQAMEQLKNYDWPGNVRELEHAIERAVAMANTTVLFPEDFPFEKEWPAGAEAKPAGESNTHSLEKMEKAHILAVLQNVHFNKSKASEVLGIDRATLYRRAQKLGIDLRGKL